MGLTPRQYDSFNATLCPATFYAADISTIFSPRVVQLRNDIVLNLPDNANSPEQRQILDALPVLVLLERGGDVVFANREARSLLGETAGEWVPRPVDDILWGLSSGTAEPQTKLAATKNGSPFHATIQTGAGGYLQVEGAYCVVEGEPRQSIIVAHVTSQEKAPKTRLMEDVLNSLPEAVAIEHGEHLLYVNPSFTEMFGYAVDETSGKGVRELIVPETRLNEHGTLLKIVSEQGIAAAETVRGTKSGELIDVSLQMSPLLVNDQRVGIVYSFRDIGERKETEARLQHDAMHDVLTGLPNRALFKDRVTLALSRRARRPDQSCGVLYLDLDKFKEINDSLGHAAGDVLLRAVAERLLNVLRPQDSAARLGGDEFAVLLEGILTTGDLEVVGNRILKELERTYEIYGHMIQSGASIGAAMAGAEHATADLLIRDADYAMYRAKQSGGQRLEIFDRHLEVSVSSQQERERELRSILENELFEFWYQPIFRLMDGRLEGLESMLIWRRADGTIENSRELLAMAEETGLSIPLAYETIEAVCKQLRAWSDQLPQSSFYLSVNLTSRQFYHEEFLEQLVRALAQSGANPLRLVMEVPESVLNENPDAAIAILQRIVDHNVRVAVDEFGSSLAPLNHLIRMPLDFLKLDGKLTAAAEMRGRHQALLESLIQLGKTVGVQVVARGIETPEQVSELIRMGCLYGQGPMLASLMDPANAFRVAEARSGPIVMRR
jgi:Amt family ammonium transporter